MESVFFVLSKLVWFAFNPAHLLLLVLLLGLWALFSQNLFLAKRLLGWPILALVLIAFLPVKDWVLSPLEERFAVPELADNIDGIILLGGAEEPEITQAWGQFVANDSMERITTTFLLAQAHPKAKIVISGGSGRLINGNGQEAQITADFLVELGLDRSRLILEPNSRNTWENVRNTQALLQPKQAQNWVLVTSAFHMSRAVGIFQRLNWPVTAYPTAYLSLPKDHRPWDSPNLQKNLFYLNIGIREWVGLTAYYLTGKTLTWWPSGDQSQE